MTQRTITHPGASHMQHVVELKQDFICPHSRRLQILSLTIGFCTEQAQHTESPPPKVGQLSLPCHRMIPPRSPSRPTSQRFPPHGGPEPVTCRTWPQKAEGIFLDRGKLTADTATTTSTPGEAPADGPARLTRRSLQDSELTGMTRRQLNKLIDMLTPAMAGQREQVLPTRRGHERLEAPDA
ncbi:hypothetical protein GA0115257_103091 [Streptomyces sp. LcepLS]|nr:hypothetical protein GA0115257_103091 [Streptomyces sp. LcepLS]